MSMRYNGRLLFLYDKLMTKQEQKKLGIDLEFLAFGIMHGKLRKIVVRRDPIQKIKKDKIFAIPNNGSNIIFGGIFYLENYDRDSYKLHSYYHNSIPIVGETIREDLYDFIEVAVSPIKFRSFDDLKICNYDDLGNEIMCDTFIGNQFNKRVRFNSKEKRYIMPSMDKTSYIQMIKERQNEVKE